MRTLLLVLLPVATACAPPPRGAAPIQPTASLPAPPSVLEAASAAVRERMGSGFFARLVSLRPDWTEFHAESAGCTRDTCGRPAVAYYAVYFSLNPSRPGFPEGTIVVPVDTHGRAIADWPPVGAPNCAHDASQCSFSVSADSAISIARHVGLAAGSGPWAVTFTWQEGQHFADCAHCPKDFFSPSNAAAALAWQIRSVTQPTCHTAITDEVAVDVGTGAVLNRSGITVRSYACPDSEDSRPPN